MLTLDTAKVLMRFSSSRMLPWLADSICRMVSSSRLSSAFMWALFTIRLDFISDRSGRSCSTCLQSEAVPAPREKKKEKKQKKKKQHVRTGRKALPAALQSFAFVTADRERPDGQGVLGQLWAG